MSYEQNLLNKKERAEVILADELESRNWFAKREEQQKGTEIMKFVGDGFRSNKEDCDIKIEALQILIESINEELLGKVSEEEIPEI